MVELLLLIGVKNQQSLNDNIKAPHGAFTFYEAYAFLVLKSSA